MRQIGSAIVLVTVAIAAGCGGGKSEPSQASAGGDRDCVAAWNATDNDQNRSLLVTDSSAWRVDVSRFGVNHPAANSTGEGCGYLFSTDKRFISFSGAWQNDGRFVWMPELSQDGRIKPDQEIGESSLTVRSDGSIE